MQKNFDLELDHSKNFKGKLFNNYDNQVAQRNARLYSKLGIKAPGGTVRTVSPSPEVKQWFQAS